MEAKSDEIGPRASDPAASLSLTVAKALELAPLQRGAPEVLAGRDQIDRPVRWIHIAETPEVASVLRGGELLLTEGRMFEGSDADRRRFVAQLAEIHIAGIIFELDTVFTKIPAQLISEFEHRGIPLIALHVPVPFIEVTEAIHTSIVNSESARLVEGDEVRRSITDLALGGAGAPALLDALSEAVDNPIIFERGTGGIAYQALNGRQERDVLANWELFVRELPGAPHAIERRLPPVRGEDLGRVVALETAGTLGPFEEAAIDSAIPVVSLVLSSEQHEEALAARSSRGFLSALIHGEISPLTAHTRAVAAGFDAPALLSIAVARGRHRSGRSVAVEDHIWSQIWRETISELEGRHLPAMVDPQPTATATLVVLGLNEVSQRQAVTDRFASMVTAIATRRFDEDRPLIVSVGSAVHTWPSAVEALASAVEGLRSAAFARPRPWYDAHELDLDRLLWTLRDHPDLARFSSTWLDPLVAYDEARNTQLMVTLETFLTLNGHKAETARGLHLERQSLYNRIERIEEILDLDLSDAETRLSLHIALRVREKLNQFPTAAG